MPTPPDAPQLTSRGLAFQYRSTFVRKRNRSRESLVRFGPDAFQTSTISRRIGGVSSNNRSQSLNSSSSTSPCIEKSHFPFRASTTSCSSPVGLLAGSPLPSHPSSRFGSGLRALIELYIARHILTKQTNN